MKPEILELLQAVDDPGLRESPANFDWEKSIARVQRLKPLLEEIVGRPFKLDDNIQDASFFAILAIQRSGGKPNHLDTVIAASFSCFGDLFTVWGNSPMENLPQPLVQRIIAEIEKAGFHYIDQESLAEPYTGQNRVFKGRTWGYRFFDWI